MQPQGRNVFAFLEVVPLQRLRLHRPGPLVLLLGKSSCGQPPNDEKTFRSRCWMGGFAARSAVVFECAMFLQRHFAKPRQGPYVRAAQHAAGVTAQPNPPTVQGPVRRTRRRQNTTARFGSGLNLSLAFLVNLIHYTICHVLHRVVHTGAYVTNGLHDFVLSAQIDNSLS